MTLNKQKRILFDWGGTIARDADLYKKLALDAGAKKPLFKGPDSWYSIKSVCPSNPLEGINEKIFKMADLYDSAVETINKHTGKSGRGSKSETFIVYDTNPAIDLSKDGMQLLFAGTIKERRLKVNGIYIDSDKISLCKKLGINIAVEDDPRIALAMASTGIKVILLSRLWNRFFDIEKLDLYISHKKKSIIENNLYLAEDWKEAGLYIEELLKKQGD